MRKRLVLGDRHKPDGDKSRRHTSAMKLCRRAAQLGHPMAQFSLGMRYAYGSNGMPQDYVAAYMWLNLAAMAGSISAKQSLSLAADNMSITQIDEAKRLVNEWKSNRKK